jgi:hypothetical protein
LEIVLEFEQLVHRRMRLLTCGERRVSLLVLIFQRQTLHLNRQLADLQSSSFILKLNFQFTSDIFQEKEPINDS